MTLPICIAADKLERAYRQAEAVVKSARAYNIYAQAVLDDPLALQLVNENFTQAQKQVLLDLQQWTEDHAVFLDNAKQVLDFRPPPEPVPQPPFPIDDY